MPLNPKEKGLAAVGISIAAGCRPCTDHHLGKVAELGATPGEIRQTLADALCVKRNAIDLIGAQVLTHLGDPPPAASDCDGSSNRTTELVKIGAAYSVNCTEDLERHITAGRALGVTDEEIAEIVKMSLFIKGKAVSHVDKLVDAEVSEAALVLKAAGGNCC